VDTPVSLHVDVDVHLIFLSDFFSSYVLFFFIFDFIFICSIVVVIVVPSKLQK